MNIHPFPFWNTSSVAPFAHLACFGFGQLSLWTGLSVKTEPLAEFLQKAIFCCFHGQDKNAQKFALGATSGDGYGTGRWVGGGICAPENLHGWKWPCRSRGLLSVAMGTQPLAP